MNEPLWIPGAALTADRTNSGWALQRQSSDVYRVDFQVPAGFDRYCRILHRVYSSDGTLLPWSGYAQSVDITIEPQTHWYEITRGDPQLQNVGPIESSLDRASAQAFLKFLARHLDPDACIYAGFWIGWSWLHGIDPNLPTAPLGLRDYVLFSVPLSVLIREYKSDPSQFPGVLWPEDRSWYLSTDVDYDSTLVGGSEEFIDYLLTDQAVEALPIGPDVDLTYRALP